VADGLAMLISSLESLPSIGTDTAAGLPWRVTRVWFCRRPPTHSLTFFCKSRAVTVFIKYLPFSFKQRK
jgi:hypothetical protein